MVSLLYLSTLIAAATATPYVPRQVAPAIQLKDGTVVGSSDGTIDSWKGIPFAQPPVGPLRLKAPQPLNKGFGTIQATGTPRSCPQQSPLGSGPDFSALTGPLQDLLKKTPLFMESQNNDEDCLTINVQRPSTAKAGSKLPVLFWIYGGGFEFGSTQMYDGSGVIKQSVQMNKNIIYVTANYRVSGWGFLAGKELKAEGNTNLGLRDQRLALQWVADNIAAFGGDPEKVTIWGESAGAISVFDQTIINGGDNTYKGKKLFRGAIMNSGSAIPAVPVDHPKAQAVYDQVVKNAGCSGVANTLDCLRAAPYDKFASAINSLPSILSYSSVNLAYLPRPDPGNNFFPLSPEELALRPDAKVADVPVIVGDQEDEGTLFSILTNNVTDSEKLTTYLESYFPLASRAEIRGLVDTYPTDPAAGSPYTTGILYDIYPGYKRNAALLGDATFTLTRRGYLKFVSQRVPMWSYLATYLRGTPVLGTLHGSDLAVLYFGLMPSAQKYIFNYYINFINGLDPNAGSGTFWPRWREADGRKLLQFEANSQKVIADDFRTPQYDYLIANAQKFRA